MGILIVFFIMLIISIVGAVISKKRKGEIENSWFFIVPCLALICVGCLIGILKVQLVSQTEYEETLGERTMLVYRIENTQDTTDILASALYDDIAEFNKSLKNVKDNYNNFWVLGFYNSKIATIDYIEIDGIIPF